MLSQKSYPHQLAQDPDIQRLLHPWEEASGKTPASPLAGVGCLAGWVTQPQTNEEDNSKLVIPMFFHRPSMTSTYDSAGSIASPPRESDLDDEQIRKMLASPLFSQGREVSADRSRVHHSCSQNSVTSSSHFRESAGKPAAVWDINQFKEKTKLYPGSLIRKKLRDRFLKNKEIIFSQKQNLKS